MFPSCQLIKLLSSLSVFSGDLEVPFMAFEYSLNFSISIQTVGFNFEEFSRDGCGGSSGARKRYPTFHCVSIK